MRPRKTSIALGAAIVALAAAGAADSASAGYREDELRGITIGEAQPYRAQQKHVGTSRPSRSDMRGGYPTRRSFGFYRAPRAHFREDELRGITLGETAGLFRLQPNAGTSRPSNRAMRGAPYTGGRGMRGGAGRMNGGMGRR